MFDFSSAGGLKSVLSSFSRTVFSEDTIRRAAMFKVLCNGFALSYLSERRTGSLRARRRDFANLPGSDALRGGVSANFFAMCYDTRH